MAQAMKDGLQARTEPCELTGTPDHYIYRRKLWVFTGEPLAWVMHSFAYEKEPESLLIQVYSESVLERMMAYAQAWEKEYGGPVVVEKHY